MTKKFFTTLALMAGGIMFAQAQQNMKPEETEVWTPVPKVVTPGKSCGDAPSDALILFDGKNLNQWVLTNDTTKQADWIVGDGVITVNKKSGNIQTKQS